MAADLRAPVGAARLGARSRLRRAGAGPPRPFLRPGARGQAAGRRVAAAGGDPIGQGPGGAGLPRRPPDPLSHPGAAVGDPPLPSGPVGRARGPCDRRGPGPRPRGGGALRVCRSARPGQPRRLRPRRHARTIRAPAHRRAAGGGRRFQPDPRRRQGQTPALRSPLPRHGAGGGHWTRRPGAGLRPAGRPSDRPGRTRHRRPGAERRPGGWRAPRNRVQPAGGSPGRRRRSTTRPPARCEVKISSRSSLST